MHPVIFVSLQETGFHQLSTPSRRSSHVWRRRRPCHRLGDPGHASQQDMNDARLRVRRCLSCYPTSKLRDSRTNREDQAINQINLQIDLGAQSVDD